MLATDFDGTLAPIVAQPEFARPEPQAAALLCAMARERDFRVALVSGRALVDRRRRCDIPGGWYIGGHGNETQAPPGEAESHRTHQLKARRELELVAGDIRALLPAWPGARLETKPYSLALHFRQAPRWESAIREAFSLFATQHGLRILMGRKVVELLPADAMDKGTAVKRLRTRLQCDLTIYFGDDVTDEDVFRSGGPALIGVKVDHLESPGTTSEADFRLESPEQMAAALVAIQEARPTVQKKSVHFWANTP